MKSIFSDHPFSSNSVALSILKNVPQFSYWFTTSQVLLSLHVISDWLNDGEIRALWGLHHLLQDYSFLFSLKVIFLWLKSKIDFSTKAEGIKYLSIIITFITFSEYWYLCFCYGVTQLYEFQSALSCLDASVFAMCYGIWKTV